MTTPARLEVASFPEHVHAAVEEQRWDDLIAALDGGLPATLFGRKESLHLLPFVLSYHEAGYEQAVAPIPVSVLEAFVRQGLGPGTVVDRVGAVALAARHGQWSWAHRLLDRGWPVDEPDAATPTLHVLLHGHAARQRLGVFRSVSGLMTQTFFTDHFQAKNPAPELPPNVHALPVPPVHDFQDDVLASSMRRFFARLDELVTHRRALAQSDARGALTLTLRLMAEGADQTTPGRWRGEDTLRTPLEKVILMREAGWAAAMLDSRHAATGVPPGSPALAAATGDVATLRALLDRLSPSRFEEEATLAAFATVAANHRFPLGVLFELGLPLDVRDPSGWTLAQRAAERGLRPVLGMLTRRGVDLDAPTQTGPTAGDLLRLNHPHACADFGLALPEEQANVRVLRRRGPR